MAMTGDPKAELVSLSHWGMFDMPRPVVFTVPAGFKFDHAEVRLAWGKPGAIIPHDTNYLANKIP